MTVIKYSSDTWVLQKAEGDVLDVIQRNYLRIECQKLFILKFINASVAKRAVDPHCPFWLNIYRTEIGVVNLDP